MFFTPIIIKWDFFWILNNIPTLAICIFLITIILQISERLILRYIMIIVNLNFIWALIIWLFCHTIYRSYFFMEYSIYFFPMEFFRFSFALDAIGLYFLLLTNLFIYLCLLNISERQYQLKYLIFFICLLYWAMFRAFSILNLLGFFFFFEITLVPIFFIILQWGSRERKVRASFLIFLYTLLGSIFLFFNIFYLKSKTGSVDYIYLLSIFFSKRDQLFLWITFFFAFAIKIPMFPFHIWLPEAHVEAPTIGSVILAALVLKLGLYGILRFCLPLFPYATFYYRPFINMFALLGILYTCLIALRQIDIKKIIAYSSINHMNVVLLGLVALQVESIEGAIFQMLSHGIISGALFFSVGILYERYGVRSLKFFGGLVFLYPLFSLFFFIFIIANISFPLTSSFVGEFLIFSGLIYEDLSIVFISLLSIIFGLFYNMWMYNRIFFGNLKNSFINIYINLSRKEIYLFSLLIFYLFLLGIGSFIILDDLHNSVLILLKIIRLG